jgi:NSS family neurotransmitter:Na+ symporter
MIEEIYNGGRRSILQGNREQFGSRLGFLLVSAGCAIGIGNVWRFPFITGKYGGAAFVLVYLVFLIIMGLPILTMELAIGRAAKKSIGRALHVLEPSGTFWHLHSYTGYAGNLLLMMFYTNVSGWMLSYIFKMANGDLLSGPAGAQFTGMLADPTGQIFWMYLTIIVGFAIVWFGVQSGVEKITKPMMVCLFVLITILAIHSVTLEGAQKGIEFYLLPDFGKMVENGIGTVVYAAMGQAFFTLSVGIGSMLVFGSYISKGHSLFGESCTIIAMDTFIAIMAGLIIFPACFAYNVNPGAGPGLIFVTLPEVFRQMSGGIIWGTLFFIFMCFASFSTVIAVFENMVSICMDFKEWSRKKAVLINCVLVLILSVPCVLGFNEWSSFQPLGAGTAVLDLEDFLVSNNILPLGGLLFVLFCTCKKGWGFDKFLEEANTGTGLKLPAWTRGYLTYVLPIMIVIIFIMGYKDIFFK